MSKIFIIEDDPDILELVQYNLEKDGFTVETATNGESGLRDVAKSKPDLLILDLMLPGMDGLEVCRRLRRLPQTAVLPVIMLTAKGEESDVIVGLEIGADDYMVKPFSPKELIARVRAVLRRGSAVQTGTNVVRVGPLTIDSERHEVRVDNVLLPLTLAEFRLLSTLASRPGRVFTRDQLLEKITGGDVVVIDRNVDVHIRAIRKKLEGQADMIQTVRGVGYKCRDQDS